MGIEISNPMDIVIYRNSHSGVVTAYKLISTENVFFFKEKHIVCVEVCGKHAFITLISGMILRVEPVNTNLDLAFIFVDSLNQYTGGV